MFVNIKINNKEHKGNKTNIILMLQEASRLENLFTLEGKTALVTGVSRGLGQGMAVGLAEAGANIVGISISDTSETKKAVEETGREFTAIHADLSTPDKGEEAARRLIHQHENIDILVNNAGTIRRAPAEEYTVEDWDAVIDLNLNTVFRLCSVIGNHMIKRGSGKIINIASMLSFQGGMKVPAYTASKHAVAGLTKSLANEWAKKGVCVNAIAPGYMATDNTRALRDDPERGAFILSRIPAERWGEPEDLKGPVVFLASSASDYVSGHVLCVDGGWMNF